MEIMIKIDVEGNNPIEVADIVVQQLRTIKRVSNAFVVHRDSYTQPAKKCVNCGFYSGCKKSKDIVCNSYMDGRLSIE